MGLKRGFIYSSLSSEIARRKWDSPMFAIAMNSFTYITEEKQPSQWISKLYDKNCLKK